MCLHGLAESGQVQYALNSALDGKSLDEAPVNAFSIFSGISPASSFAAYITWLDMDSTADFHCLFPSIFTEIVTLYGFGLEITWQLILQATFIVGVTSAIGALSFIPNGAGITEISNAGLLLAMVSPIQPIMGLGMAAAAAFLQGFFHKWFRVLLGLAVAVIFRNRLFNKDLELALRDEEVQEPEVKIATA